MSLSHQDAVQIMDWFTKTIKGMVDGVVKMIKKQMSGNGEGAYTCACTHAQSRIDFLLPVLSSFASEMHAAKGNLCLLPSTLSSPAGLILFCFVRQDV